MHCPWWLCSSPLLAPFPSSLSCWNRCDCYYFKCPGKLHLFTTSCLTSSGKLQNSQLSGISIFNISFKGWSKANDDNFKALLGGNDLSLNAGRWLKFTNQVAASGSVIEKCGGQSVFLSFIRAQVWEFINLCLGLAVMSLFTPLIKQTSVWLKAGWPSLDTEINSAIREKISHLCLAYLRNSLTCMWVSCLLLTWSKEQCQWHWICTFCLINVWRASFKMF